MSSGIHHNRQSLAEQVRHPLISRRVSALTLLYPTIRPLEVPLSEVEVHEADEADEVDEVVVEMVGVVGLRSSRHPESFRRVVHRVEILYLLLTCPQITCHRIREQGETQSIQERYASTEHVWQHHWACQLASHEEEP